MQLEKREEALILAMREAKVTPGMLIISLALATGPLKDPITENQQKANILSRTYDELMKK